MSRIKKNRTAGNSGPKFNGQRKETSAQAKEARERKRQAKLKGHKAGSRNIDESIKQTPKNKAKQPGGETRIGSKKPISLIIEEAPKQQEKPKTILQPKVKVVKSKVEEKLSPEKELALIENDQRLNDLLEQLDNGEELSTADQSWVDKKMERHQQLMQELGWLDDEGEEDLLQQFEDAATALNEFKE
jgi:ribosome assembly protein YihI (activator of Der GTPase)